MRSKRVRVLFLCRQLHWGGAERQLIELVRGLRHSEFDITVLNLYAGGALLPDLARLEDVTVLDLGKKRRWHLASFLWRLANVVREVRPNIIHGYLGVPNLLALALARPLRAKVVWGVRASGLDWSRYDWLERLVFQLQCLGSRFVDLVVANSRAGLDYHAAHGFPRQKLTVIPNGIDAERFAPDREARQSVRSEWGIGDEETVIGLVGRLDPMKGHSTFLRAAALVAERRTDVRFVCVGDGAGPYAEELRRLGHDLGFDRRLAWVGARRDVEAVYNGLDVACSSSVFGEGFPNVVGEAMACGVPCVVTDVGDAAWVVGDTGIVVPPGHPEALAAGMETLIGKTSGARLALGSRARARIVAEFSPNRLVQRTAEALLGLVE